MTKFKTQIRWIAIASAAVAGVLLSGCAIDYSGAQRLERWEAGETKDFALVSGVHPLDPAHFDILPAVNGEDSYGATHELTHT